uniref:Uncharacterized protein MANES_08G008500 n=1 Tax=Rhizophora mucronata TaxID=61149 RepID=A0A2P2KX36_RHIMU
MNNYYFLIISGIQFIKNQRETKTNRASK